MKSLIELYEVKNELIEQLAEIEHDQWMTWAKSIMEQETLSPDRVKRWIDECIMPYSELSEEMKEFDREWARKVVDTYDKYNGAIDNNINSVDEIYDHIKSTYGND